MRVFLVRRRFPFFSAPLCLCVASSLAIVSLGLSLACSPKSSSKPPVYFPESNEAPGWVKSGETRTFPADRLWEYIDGDADKYVQAGVQQTLTTDYRYGQIEATADVFVMSHGAGAAKIFESQPATGGQPVQLGEAARLYKGSLILRQGHYFVRLVAYEDAPQVADALVSLGRAIASKLDNPRK